MTSPDRRLRRAATLEVIRGVLSALSGLPFFATAAMLWVGRPAPSQGSWLGDRLMLLIPSGALFAIAVASFLFARMILTRKKWALWMVVLGESVLAILLVVAAIGALANGGNIALAVAAIAAVALVSVPIIVRLVWALAHGEPAGAREGGY